MLREQFLISTSPWDFLKLNGMKIRTVPSLITLMLGCLAVCEPNAHAVSPPPDGGYPGLNTAEGTNALKNLTTGAANTAVGWFSLFSNTDGSFNTGVGAGTLVLNVGDQSTGEGVDNTAVGAVALFLNTTGSDNTAVGTAALLHNDSDSNTAFGAFALNSNTSGTSNTAIGDRALLNNTIGGGHTAVGFQALQSNIAATGPNTAPDGIGPNTAIGAGALFTNTSGNGNTAVGVSALHNNDTGLGNTAIGASAGSSITGNFNICIGESVFGAAAEDNTIRIGDNLSDTQGDSACYIGGIYNQLGDPGTLTVLGIDADGKLATAPSSRRFKQDIKPMDKASEAILALKPVAFHYKGDAKNTPCFGLIAEEVAEVNPDLVVRNKNGEIWTVRYEQINAMLLNEFLKEHRNVQAQETTIAGLKSTTVKQEATIAELKSTIVQQQQAMEAVTVQLKEQAAQIQKVSMQVELGRSATKLARDNP
jgi:uncharacterized coiled-coil protein SlyX